MDIGYARVPTAKQDLARQVDALSAAGIKNEHIFVDKKSGATIARPGLQEALTLARDGDVLIVHTLDQLGRTVRDTMNRVHDLKERGVGVRTLADPLTIDTAEPDSPMAQRAFVVLALFGQMERTYAPNHAVAAPSRPQPLQPHHPWIPRNANINSRSHSSQQNHGQATHHSNPHR